MLLALNPLYAVSFMLHHGIIGFVTLGAVFLAVTGAEALYADLGHFGKRPIQTAWLFIVLPSLALNYLGQGALVIANPKAIENPFFLMFPDWALLPMVVLATVGDRDREPGRDHRRLFADPSGHSARPAAAVRNPPHVGIPLRPDLHPAHQHAAR